jgi:hypothetical protein
LHVERLAQLREQKLLSAGLTPSSSISPTIR